MRPGCDKRSWLASRTPAAVVQRVAALRRAFRPAPRRPPPTHETTGAFARYSAGRNGAAMTSAEHGIAVSEQHLAECEERVGTQLKLVEDLKAGGQVEAAAEAERGLAETLAAAAQAKAELAAARERVRGEGGEAPYDDDKMDAVMRDCPM
jgi:hypothetical protein